MQYLTQCRYNSFYLLAFPIITLVESSGMFFGRAPADVSEGRGVFTLKVKSSQK